jgi:uridine phosphorylase
MSDVFHLSLTREMLQGATLAIVPGDPGRVAPTARAMDRCEFLATNREFTTWLGWLDETPVVVCSTGIGGPSVSICVEELAQLGIRTFLRLGTTGAIQPEMQLGDVVVTTGAIRLDGASQHFAPLVFPAVADFECTTALVTAARAAGVGLHIGVTVSSDTFYQGQERYDTYSGRVPEHLRGSLGEWRSMGALNYEMETATLFTMCATQGLHAGCVAGVIVNRTQSETPDEGLASRVQATTVAIVVDAARRLLHAG